LNLRKNPAGIKAIGIDFKSAMLTKKTLRSKMLSRLKIQKEEDRNRKSRIIKAKLFKNPVFKKAKRVMFYISFDGEVNTEYMIKETQKLGKIIAVPVCKIKRTIKPCLLGRGESLKKGLYGILEPAIERSINLKDLDLVIVPGVAFDKKGNRLGRGKGYYDRFLKKLPKTTTSVGLGFDFQILPFVPATTQDARVNEVIFA
jgi:5-formyltetrahydrofolate cyclo-ligase